jgi:hypothetical protein
LHQDTIYITGERSRRSLGLDGVFGPRAGVRKDADYAKLKAIMLKYNFTGVELCLLLGYERSCWCAWRDRGRLNKRILARARALVKLKVRPERPRRAPLVFYNFGTIPLEHGRLYEFGEYVTRKRFLRAVVEYNKRQKKLQKEFRIVISLLGEKGAWLVRRRRSA